MSQESKKAIAEVEAGLKKLVNSFQQSSIDVKACQKTLSSLKLQLIHFNLVPPFDDMNTAKKQLLLARATAEYAVMLSIEARDVNSFERHIAQVKPYYFDFESLLGPISDRKYEILGLNLLGLLAHNRIADFHTELELISPDQHENVYIKYPLQLEQRLMEGSYNKVLSARGQMPVKRFGFFMDMLVNTVRDKIAECAEKAYETFPLEDAASLLMLDSKNAINEYGTKRKWQLHDGVISFPRKKDDSLDIPSHALIRQTLAYATELERIV